MIRKFFSDYFDSLGGSFGVEACAQKIFSARTFTRHDAASAPYADACDCLTCIFCQGSWTRSFVMDNPARHVRPSRAFSEGDRS
jgi:hypothetical protein